MVTSFAFPTAVLLTALPGVRCGRFWDMRTGRLGFTMVDLRAFLEGGSEGGGC
jgi:hypothetical protein